MSNLPLSLKIIADDRHNVIYRRSFARITGSVLGAILLQQILFRFDNNNGEKFYKFMQPCKHPKYQEDDSWTEELEFTRYELAAALKAIGTKSTGGANKNELMAVTEPKFNAKGAMENASNLVIYWTDSSRVTWFWLNAPLLGNAVTQHYLGKSTEQNYLVNLQNSNTYVKSDSRITYKTENTKDSNTKDTAPKEIPKAKKPKPTTEILFRNEWSQFAGMGMALLKVFNLDFVPAANQTMSALEPYLDVAKQLTQSECVVADIPALYKYVSDKSKREEWSQFGVRSLARHYTGFLKSKQTAPDGQSANTHPALMGVKLVIA